jgi:hypothetical protein
MCHMPNILSPLRPLYRYERRRDLPEAFNQSRAHLSRIAWQKFSVECDSGSIAKTGVVWQPISDEWAGRFLSILGSSEPASLRRDDYVDGYMATLSDLIISYLNIVNDYRSVTPPLLVALRGFLDEQIEHGNWKPAPGWLASRDPQGVHPSRRREHSVRHDVVSFTRWHRTPV